MSKIELIKSNESTRSILLAKLMKISNNRNLSVAISKVLETDFSKEDFSKANLSGLNLVGLNFSWANFSGANLEYSTLENANLTGANLTEAKLTGIDLTGANLTEADLFGAEMFSATLTDADFTKSKVGGIDFRTFSHDPQVLDSCNIQSAQGFSWRDTNRESSYDM